MLRLYYCVTAYNLSLLTSTSIWFGKESLDENLPKVHLEFINLDFFTDISSQEIKTFKPCWIKDVIC